MIELENIVYSAGSGGTEGTKNIILDGLSLRIDDGKYVVITGPNGGGKTSLAKIIMGIVSPESGRVLLNGEDITSLNVTDRAKRGIRYAFQHPPRFKGLTVKDMLEISYGDSLKRDLACDFLTKVGLCAGDYLSREVDSSLSGGELKRIEIATLLASGASVLIFDEPEAGIDLWSFHRLTSTFREFHQNTDCTIIIISHQERIINQADEVLLVAGGNLVARGEPSDIMPKIDDFAVKTCCKISEAHQ